MTVLDLFAGPGGWSQALRALGLDEIGLEWSPPAVATARAAGHVRVQGDVRDYVPDRDFDGLIASPPCQTFSNAGNGAGRKALDRLLAAVPLVGDGVDPLEALRSGGSGFLDDAVFGDDDELDERSVLVLEPLRFVHLIRPSWIALEQVPAVMPVWHAYAAVLRRQGYSVWTGVLHAEQYGVPQTRKRAILIAHRHRQMRQPPPTHSRYHGDPDKLDRGVLPWVSMSEAIRHITEPAPTIVGVGGAQWAMRSSGNVGAAVDRSVESPSPTILGGGSATWSPRVNDQSGTARDALWPQRRPATTVAGRDLIADPGANANRFNGSTKSRNDGVRVTIAEAGVLQTFPRDYPWQGSQTQQYQQVGDAVPPLLAEAVLRAVADFELVCEECGNDLATQGYAYCSDCLEAGASL
jgi:DNA (cytosine-5)-methyltransferase 1